ncbi:branched-chain amino acid transaminase, partial [Hortaea werneckii]
LPPRITPYQNLSLDPATCVLHYAFEAFEGMKAYKDKDNNVRLFRPDMNMKRMNKSAARIALPTFEGDKFIELLKEFCRMEERFIPSTKGYSLYIRPNIIGTQRTLGVGPPGSALLYTIASPVGPYYPTGFKAISLEATTYAVRAWPGGVGASKLGANYAPCIVPQMQAAGRGFHQNLWLFEDIDPETGKQEDFVTEVGTMNLFACLVGRDGVKELVTAPLDGTILEGVVRDSILGLAKERLVPEGWKVSERRFHMRELAEAASEGRLLEVFGSGTAAVVSPVRSIGYQGNLIGCGLPDGVEVGEITKRMKDWIEGIQYGEEEHPWSVKVLANVNFISSKDRNASEADRKMREEDTRGPIFEDVVFTVIPSEDIADEQQIIDMVSSQGGEYVNTDPSDLDLARIPLTHIISANIDFPQYTRAIERGIFVVKPSWVDQSARKGKFAGPRQHSPDPSQYFQDVVLTCADLPEGDKDAIIAGVIALGGQYTGPLSKLVTHIVTLNDQVDKCQTARVKKVNCKIVLPHWFDDCLRLGKKINERPYVFPDPQILRGDDARPPPGNAPHVEGATGALGAAPTLPDTPPPSPSETRKNLNAFMSKKIMLSKDLDLSAHLQKTLEGLINHGGGTLTDDVDEADIYIGQYRDGVDYIKASINRKEVANLPWLYHVINKNKYTNPLSKLLHYPVPRNGIEGFHNMVISISNYNGDARIYLENLITLLGARFTKTMKQDNSHLITARKRSEKFEAAQEWNIHVANHLWVEESYAKCQNQSLTNQRYTTFPDKTNLGEVCGQTPLDMKVVEKAFFSEKIAQAQGAVPPPQPQKQNASPQKSMPASSAMPENSTPKGAAQEPAPTPVPEDVEMEEEGTAEVPTTAKKACGRPKKDVTTTPRLLDEEKENETPENRSTGRAAKTEALRRSKGQGEDHIKYQREMRRPGGVTHGGRRSSHMEDFSSPAPPPKRAGKRKSDENTYDVTAEGSALSDGETQDKPTKTNKKAKHSAAGATTTSELPPIEYKMMVTGDERWIGNPKKEDADKSQLRLLGVQLTDKPEAVDILVAPRILRTKKFVAALASAPLVVDSKYLDTALKQGKLPSKPALLHDRETEDRLGFRLSEALDRARTNRHKLLAGWTIFVTKDIQGGFETYKEIIRVNGGEVMMYAGRTGLKMPPSRRSRRGEENKKKGHGDEGSGSEDGEGGEAVGEESQNQGDEDELDCVYLVSGTTEAEKKLWKGFRSTAEKQELVPRIVRTDWLLNAAMSQRVRWDAKWALDE